MSPTDSIEVCPSCGDFSELIPATGFCATCTGNTCRRCGDPLDSGSYCNDCRRIRWLEKNAEAIEDNLLRGLSLRQSILQVADSIRPTCIICNEPIPRGTNGRHFICTKNVQCRQARRRYRYLVYDKGYSKEAAIEAITNGRQDD